MSSSGGGSGGGGSSGGGGGRRRGPRPPPFAVQEIDRCFGQFNGATYDVSGLSPVQAYAKLSAVYMLTTARVGDEEEDPTMTEARPRLSEINRKGFLTTDSQMGKKGVEQGVPYWQRSYLQGLMPRHLARNLHLRLDLEDSVMVLVNAPHSLRRIPGAPRGGTIPVTLVDKRFPTQQPVAMSEMFDETILNVLPDVESIMSDEHCVELLRQDAVNFRIVDMVWGRPFWLFDKVSQLLDVVNDDTASPPLPPPF